MSQPSLPAHRPSRSPDGAKRTERQGSRWQQESRTGSTTTALAAVLVLSTMTALAACSVQRPGAAEDHSLDTVEQNRAAMGVAPADSSYDQAERNRLTVGTPSTRATTTSNGCGPGVWAPDRAA